jgi:electron transport complex protein RnfB
MLAAVVTLLTLGLLFGLGLGWAAIRFRVEADPVVEQIDALLPQTQCAQCGYPGCRPYAEAIASGAADINQCPPGGAAGIAALADLLGREPKPLNPENGAEKPRAVAVIDEPACIGCTLCIQACPVDAIVGASKQMHTVIASECTGCDLCLPPCPVDCIDMVVPEPEPSEWRWPRPRRAAGGW